MKNIFNALRVYLEFLIRTTLIFRLSLPSHPSLSRLSFFPPPAPHAALCVRVAAKNSNWGRKFLKFSYTWNFLIPHSSLLPSARFDPLGKNEPASNAMRKSSRLLRALISLFVCFCLFFFLPHRHQTLPARSLALYIVRQIEDSTL